MPPAISRRPRIERLEDRALLSASSVVPTTVTGPKFDLAAERAEVPATVSVGQRLIVPFTIANCGDMEANLQNTYDSVYLSADARLDAADVHVSGGGGVEPGGSRPGDLVMLPPGQRVTRPQAVFVPPLTAPGSMYLLFRTNVFGDHFEPDRANNVLAVPVTVLVPDVKVTDLAARDAGANFWVVSWRDANVGAGAAPGDYTDRVRVQDARTGTVLVEKTLRTDDTRGYLAPGSSTARQLIVPLPADFLQGELTFTVTANANRAFREDGRIGGPVDNNIASVTRTVGLPAAPAVTATVAVNDGAAQRSSIKSLTVSFSTIVDVAAGAVKLTRAGGGEVAGVDVALSQQNGRTQAVLTFRGTDVVGGSLADGRYTLLVSAAGVRGANGARLAADMACTFHRLYGDFDGDGRVGAADLGRFLTAFGSRRGQTTYLWAADYHDDGTVDSGNDYKQFLLRYGKSV